MVPGLVPGELPQRQEIVRSVSTLERVSLALVEFLSLSKATLLKDNSLLLGPLSGEDFTSDILDTLAVTRAVSSLMPCLGRIRVPQICLTLSWTKD